MNEAYDPQSLVAAIADAQAKLGEVTTFLSVMTSAIAEPTNPMHEFHRDEAAHSIVRTAEVLESVAEQLRDATHLTLDPSRG